MGRSATSFVRRALVVGVPWTISKQNSPPSDTACNLLQQRRPDGAIPRNFAAGQSRESRVAVWHTIASTDSIRLNYEPPSQQTLRFSETPPKENGHAVNRIVVRPAARPRGK